MQDKIIIQEIELKAAIYDYVMSHIIDKNFEDVAAVAGDVLKIVLDTGTVINPKENN